MTTAGDNWLYTRGLESGLNLDSALARNIKKKARNAFYVDTDRVMVERIAAAPSCRLGYSTAPVPQI